MHSTLAMVALQLSLLLSYFVGILVRHSSCAWRQFLFPPINGWELRCVSALKEGHHFFYKRLTANSRSGPHLLWVQLCDSDLSATQLSLFPEQLDWKGRAEWWLWVRSTWRGFFKWSWKSPLGRRIKSSSRLIRNRFRAVILFPRMLYVIQHVAWKFISLAWSCKFRAILWQVMSEGLNVWSTAGHSTLTGVSPRCPGKWISPRRFLGSTFPQNNNLTY